MIRALLLSLVFTLPALASDAPPEVPLKLEPICSDGELVGFVFQANETGRWQFKWPANICAFGDA